MGSATEASQPEVTEQKSAAGATEDPAASDDEDLFGENEETEENTPATAEASVAEADVVPKDEPATESAPAVSTKNAPVAVPPLALKPEGVVAKPPGTPEAAVQVAALPVADSTSISIPKKIKSPQSNKAVVSGLTTNPPTAPPVNLTATAPTTTYIQGSTFGLSDEVKIPISVDTKLLEGAILAKLKALPPNLSNDALQEYDDALKQKGGSIRNKGAYLYGVIKRYTSVHDRATTGGEGTKILPMGPGLTPAVNAKLETLVTSGFCSREEMNDKVKSKIRMLSEKDALFAVDELASTDRASIRNFGSFFMGILNRYMRGDTQSRHDPLPVRPSSFSSRSNRFDRAPNSFGGRDRSRDGRPPPDRGPVYRGRDNHQQYQRPDYDPRQQRPPWQQRSGPPPSQQPPSMGYNNAGPPSNYAPPPQYQPQQPPPNQQFVPQNGGYQPGMPPPPQQHQPPPPGYGQMQQNSGYAPPQQMMGQQPNQPPTYNMGNPSYQRPPPQQQSHGWQQQSFPPHPSQPGPSPQGQMLDIMALADKASSAVQALASQNPAAPPRGPYGQHPYGGQQQQLQQQQPPPPAYGQPQNQYQTPNPSSFPPPQQPTAYGAPSGMPQAPQPLGMTQQRPRVPNRHTTATMDMLPQQVQYAVQNLIATGHVERTLDEGILGMIYDLPEGMALASLQKFATIDKSTIKNRTAYLIGLLRRELEKINRR